MSQNTLDAQIELPSANIETVCRTLIGFEQRYQSIKKHLIVALLPEKVKEWSKRFHSQVIPLCDVIRQRHPLFLFSGDVGTGKTITAECVANRFTGEMDKDGFLLKLSTRVRGRGLHGEMSQLIQEAFENLKIQAGKKRLSYLLIDEADSIATLRTTEQMHQEEKASVNTLIQKIDNIRELGGRAVIFLCTNRPNVIDQAIVRRSALMVQFDRPTKKECLDLLVHDLRGTGLSEQELERLASMTSSGGFHGDCGYTFSDLRLRLLPEALVRSFPTESLTFDVLVDAIRVTPPSPRMT